MPRRLTAKGSRDKGLAYERELISFFQSEPLSLAVSRGVAGAQAFDARRGSSDLYGLPRLDVEAKRTETLALHSAMAQAIRNATAMNYPCVIHRRSRQPTEDSSVIMRLKDFAVIYDGYLRYQGFKADD